MAQLISIQERGEIEGGWQAVVRFNNGPVNFIKVCPPFSDEQEQELEWYFEEHLAFPFTQKVRAQNAAKSIPTYGEKLFNQVFEQNAKVLVAYKTALQAGLNDAQIEIEGTPKFHSLHWEALKDPELHDPLVLQATMVRKNLVPSAIQSQARPSPTINLLVVTARPSGQRDVGYRTISRPLVEALRQTSIPIRIEILRPGTYKALENHLRDTTAKHGEGYYHVVHFDVHGAVLSHEQLQKGAQANRIVYNQRYAREDIQPYEGVKAFLSFESEQADNKSDPVEASELADLLLKHHVPITILNACQSGMQIGERETSLGSCLMQAGVQLVLAMGYSVTVSAAELMMRTLYQKLFENDDLTVAIRHARAELYNHKERRAYFDQKIDLEDWLLPVVYQNAPVALQPRELTPPERAAWFESKAEEKSYIPPEPTYGFVGRDLDILQIEKRLLAKRNLLLVRGMGGAGKTTLLRHLGGWWHTTGFVQRVFYFGYDTRAWTLQHIMMEIAQQLYGPSYYTNFQPLSLKAQQAMLASDLRGAHHLLMLDNLESITGAHLAIQHTLHKEEQDALRSFLSDLARGKTRVLLGSRSGEEWLAKGTFDDNIYDLPGLDDEAASLLADGILVKCNATRYSHDEKENENLRKLIKLLDGFPLAMEVVLANLAKQTPQEILDALQAGDVKIDPHSDSQEKTASILRCIDYSHSNLSPEAQQLLLCLAPFTSVVWTNYLDEYSSHLKQQSILANLPFDRWSEVLHEAQNWGLLGPHEISSYLHMQPTLAYFLRNQLNETGQVEMRKAIETAFREHYDGIGNMLHQLLRSKEPRERQLGQLLTGLEYENLMTALNLALEAQVSVLNTYAALSSYIDTTQDQQRGLNLGQMVLRQLEAYSSEKLIGQLGVEFAGLIDNIAMRQFRLKRYGEAEASYQKALNLCTQTRDIEEKLRGYLIAGVYHQLGYCAQEQRQWQQAEQYYQQALQIYIEYNDRYEQAGTYHQLGMVAQEQRQWQQAEQHYQQALQLFIEYNDRYPQATVYHQLGMVAGDQGLWQQAEHYSEQALQLFIEYNDRSGQSRLYHHLGNLALGQQQLQRAEQYYQRALQITIEHNDRYGQASTYLSLGVVAHDLQQWQQAGEYYLQALQIFMEYKDNYHTGMALRSLARLWKASDDVNVRASIAKAFGMSVEETEKMLLKMLEEWEEAQTGGSEKKE
jgi:tetratricopeptide (TPR) repeat protein